jgi:hypothetical protein
MAAATRLMAMAAAAALAACAPPVAPPDTRPQERPESAARAAPSAESRALAGYYARVQQDLLARGLLRTDGGGADAPFDARILARNFERIALFDEYADDAGTIVARQTESRLRRWEEPVRLQPVFGPSIDRDRRAEDRAALADYARRLSRASGHPVRVVGEGGNFFVYYLTEDERRGIGQDLRARIPGISDSTVRTVTNMPRSFFCLAFAFSRGADSAYVAAIAVIRDEHPDLLRLSCVHEEVAQGLGLANDSPEARPSIFNDDEEFALLTRHDELLLAMLYDDRLRPGMRPAEARPIAERIASELVPPATRQREDAALGRGGAL